jgi:DNA-binding response OmpR family regulator
MSSAGPLILLVEDDARLAEGVAQVLASEGFRVERAGDGVGLPARVHTLRPALVLLDVMMPRRDGLAALGDLRAAGSSVPVLLLTARGREEDKVRGFDLGADDYLVKPFGIAELLARIRALLRRSGGPTAPQQAEFTGLKCDFAAQTVSSKGRSETLSTHESAILRVLAATPGEVVSRARLMEQVWAGAAVTERAVDFHITGLRRKIAKVTQIEEPARILTVHGSGYKLVP